MYTLSYILPCYTLSLQVTCHAVQDTDNDEDSDNVELLTYECYHSAPAYCNNEVTEIFELHGMRYISNFIVMAYTHS